MKAQYFNRFCFPIEVINIIYRNKRSKKSKEEKAIIPNLSKEVQELRMNQGSDITRKTQLHGVAFSQ